MKQIIHQDSGSIKTAKNFYFSIKNNKVEINPADIIYLQADINYTNFFTLHEQFTTSFHLGFFEKQLKASHTFLRINRDLLINRSFMEAIFWRKNSGEIQMKNGSRLPVSRRKAKELREILAFN